MATTMTPASYSNGPLKYKSSRPTNKCLIAMSPRCALSRAGTSSTNRNDTGNDSTTDNAVTSTSSTLCPRHWFGIASRRATVTYGAADGKNFSSANDNASFSRPSESETKVETKSQSAVTTAMPASHLFSSSKALQQLSMSTLRGGQAMNRYTRERRSSIISIGLSIHTAPVDMREKLAVPEDRWEDAVRQLTSYPHIEEAGILSTCNRLELYAVAYSWNRGVREIEEWLAKSGDFELDELRPYLFLLRDRDAVQHLLRVAGGLDSLVLGEGQILAQVKNVARLGECTDGFGRQLTNLFQQAIIAGKRVRTETSIASGAVSVSSAAAELAQIKLPDASFENARVLIVGAGKMSKLLVKHLLSKGCNEMTIVNRSMERIQDLAAEFPEAKIKMRLLPDLFDCVEDANVIFTAASSETPIISCSDLVGMKCASEAVGGVRRFFDIAVPRNVDSNVNESDCSVLYNVDDLREVVEANKEARTNAADQARGILEEERRSFESWRDSLETVPTIKKLRSKAEQIRAGEMEKAMSKMGDNLSAKQRKVLEEMSKSIVNKLLHGPMQALRTGGNDSDEVSQTLDNMYALERMFDLDRELTGPALKQFAEAQKNGKHKTTES